MTNASTPRSVGWMRATSADQQRRSTRNFGAPLPMDLTAGKERTTLPTPVRIRSSAHSQAMAGVPPPAPVQPIFSHGLQAAVPPNRSDGFLPDFVGSGPGSNRSPFLVSSVSLVAKYATSAKRKDLLNGLFAYRARLRKQGMVGIQWLDGSFIGDVEGREGREPGDIDVVTFWQAKSSQTEIEARDPGISNNKAVRAAHGIDSYVISLMNPPWVLLNLACYWHGMWSRSKLGAVPCMKGYIALELTQSDDDDRRAISDLNLRAFA